MSGLSNTIDQLTFMVIVGAIILLIFAILAGSLYYIRFKRKRRARLEDMETNYSQLKRFDAIDYLKFDDIRDDMIVTDNGTCFVAAIECKGYDFYSAHIAERVATQNAYRGFINTITSPITYRMYSKTIDLDYTVNRYKDALRRVEEKMFNLNEDYKETKKTLELMETALGEQANENKEVLSILESLENMQSQIEHLKWRSFHLEDQLEYSEQISGEAAEPEQLETYVFEWRYYPLEYPVDLSESEIYKEAQKKLRSKEYAYVHALSAAGVKARRCNTLDLIEACRRHMKPLSADRYKLEEENEAFFKEIISTDKHDELDHEFCDELDFNMVHAMEEVSIELKADILNEVAAVALEQIQKSNKAGKGENVGV